MSINMDGSGNPCGKPGHLCVGSEVSPSNLKATILSINGRHIQLTNGWSFNDSGLGAQNWPQS